MTDQHRKGDRLGDHQVTPFGVPQRGPAVQQHDTLDDPGDADGDHAAQGDRTEARHGQPQLIGKAPQVHDQRQQTAHPDGRGHQVHAEAHHRDLGVVVVPGMAGRARWAAAPRSPAPDAGAACGPTGQPARANRAIASGHPERGDLAPGRG